MVYILEKSVKYLINLGERFFPHSSEYFIALLQSFICSLSIFSTKLGQTQELKFYHVLFLRNLMLYFVNN